jgi:cytochrome c-type biogenesis protein CcmE
MGSEAQTLHLRVLGDVECNSITHIAGGIKFNLVQDRQILTVTYEGRDPLPDTFRDGSQALADGHMGADGVFLRNSGQVRPDEVLTSIKYQVVGRFGIRGERPRFPLGVD